ncbi:MAG: hemerythrin domain-containing protein [Gammaproteobacteria bacterium]|nr:hemerythrin domain-containing protein [Gammaproteobacteria bacterium]
MFDFLNRKSRKDEATQDKQQEYKVAPGTSIHYDPELINNLKKDHQELLAIYTDIKALFDAGDYITVSSRLADLRTGLQGHLLTENLKLYIYLEHMLRGDEANEDLISGFRKEMNAIAKTAMNFLKKYEAIGVDKELAAVFAKDFATIGEVLTKRIEKEETVLYALYMESYN